MTDLLQLTGAERVLEIGTGSGYQAAILGRSGQIEVHTIERHPSLAIKLRLLQSLGYDKYPGPPGRWYHRAA